MCALPDRAPLPVPDAEDIPTPAQMFCAPVEDGDLSSDGDEGSVTDEEAAAHREAARAAFDACVEAQVAELALALPTRNIVRSCRAAAANAYVQAGGLEEDAEAHSLVLAESTATMQSGATSSSPSTTLIAGAAGGAAIGFLLVISIFFLARSRASKRASRKSRVSPMGSTLSIGGHGGGTEMALRQ